MEIRFAPRGIVEMDDVRFAFKPNFEGRQEQFNSEGDRNFNIRIDDRDLTREEVQSILDLYRDAEIVEAADGPVLMYDGEEIISVVDALRIVGGWNVKMRPPREEGDSPFYYLKVNVKFNDRGPVVFLKSGKAANRLYEDTVGMLDRVDIARIDLDIRPYDWEINGRQGRTAYLQSIHVVQDVNRFAARYADEEYPQE